MSETTTKAAVFAVRLTIEDTGTPKWATVIARTAHPGQPLLSTHSLFGPRKASRWSGAKNT